MAARAVALRSSFAGTSPLRLSVSRPIALRPARRVVAAQAYKITFKLPDGEKTVECAQGTSVFAAAEEAGVELPHMCRTGGCCTCTSRLESGSIKHENDSIFLDEDQVAAGFLLPCVAYPTSDLVVVTHQEEEMYTHHLPAYATTTAGNGYTL